MSRRLVNPFNRKTPGSFGADGKKEKSDESVRISGVKEQESKKASLSYLTDEWLSVTENDQTAKEEIKDIDKLDQNKIPEAACDIQSDEEFPSLSAAAREGCHRSSKKNQKSSAVYADAITKGKKSHKTGYIAWDMVSRHQVHEPEFKAAALEDRSRRRQTRERDDDVVDEDFPSLAHSATHKVRAEETDVRYKYSSRTKSWKSGKAEDLNEKNLRWSASGSVECSGRPRYTPTNTRWMENKPPKECLLSDYIDVTSNKAKSSQKVKSQMYKGYEQRGWTSDTAVVKKKGNEEKHLVEKEARKSMVVQYEEKKKNVIQKRVKEHHKWEHLPKIESDVLTLEKLQKLKDNDASHILLSLTQENSGFAGILNITTLSSTEVCLVMELVAKACKSRRQPQWIIRLMMDVENSLFGNITIPSALAVMMSESVEDISAYREYEYKILTFVENILDFLSEIGSRMPHAIIMISGLHTLIANALKLITIADGDLAKNVETKMKEVEDIKMSILKKMEADRLKSNPVTKSDSPPDDFRGISVMPTYDDIFPTQLPFLRKIKATGGYSDLMEYLDIQFRLLREDFIQPLRQGIREYLIAVENPKQHVSVRTYHKVRVLESGFSKDKFVHTITFDTSKLTHVEWEHSKRLIYGTLVCLSNDNFKTFSIATVESSPKKPKDSLLVTLDIFIEHIPGEREINLDIPMVMVETSAYFEAYRYVLAGLQNIKEGQLPFEEYIVHCKTDIRQPAYLRNQQQKKFDFGPVTESSCKSADDKRRDTHLKYPYTPEADSADAYDYRSSDESTSDDEEILDGDDDDKGSVDNDEEDSKNNESSVLQIDNWPTPEDVRLDKAQFEAFQQALTKEFVLIQGPPGTGKTYVGLKIVKTLLTNPHIWQGDNRSPMLLMCYTNHALDQFLEGIISFYKGKLVRVGGRCNNEKVEPYGIRNLRSTAANQRDYEEKGRIYVVCQNALLRTQKHIRLLKEGIIKSVYLLPFINKNHRKELTKSKYADNILLRWLELDLLDTEDNGESDSEDAERKNVHKDCSNVAKGEDNSDDSESSSDSDDGEAARAEAERKVDADENFKKLFTMHHGAGTDILLIHLRHLDEDCAKNVKSESLMTRDEELAVDDIWSIPVSERWRLYRLWVSLLQEHLENEMVMQQQQCIEAKEEYRLSKLQTDKTIMRTRSVIGMTTSGAARYQKVLSEIKPKIIIIEEAAEVLEGHVIASLSSKCQHLILIGDHQQLRPSTNVYTLAKQYNLELSLFERMVKNGLQCICLENQHRMRPSISKIMKHIYPTLRDDESVLAYPNIKGVSSNVFFISHCKSEEKNEELVSHLNIFEARYVIALCEYLIKQGYAPSTITVLTTYSAQVAYLKRSMPKESFEGVRVTAVDNYQGEENDIILLSLVRSNLEGSVGFLKIDNRVCVALSRAKHGLYVIGNFELLSKQSDLWKKIVDDLKTAGQVGSALHLYCQNHPKDSGIKASKPEDFLQAPEGGCMKFCKYQLKCGHVCASRCHPVDPHHLKYKCQVPCEKVIPKCQHIQTIPCYKDAQYVDCVYPVLREGVCGHETEVPCFAKDTAPCFAECGAVLKCGHMCKGQCCDCIQGRLHVPCTEKCNNILICGHDCLSTCSLCPPCSMPCDGCRHKTCQNACSDPCTLCDQPCSWTCKDQRCTKKCGEACNRKPCNRKCPRMLNCGHRCIGLCGEKCPVLCRQCNEDEMRAMFPEKEPTPDAVFIELVDCGHIVEVSTLDSMMRDGESRDIIQLKQCPWCKTSIRHCPRYQASINKTLQDISAVKAIMLQEWNNENTNKQNNKENSKDAEGDDNENEDCKTDEEDGLSEKRKTDTGGLPVQNVSSKGNHKGIGVRRGVNTHYAQNLSSVKDMDNESKLNAQEKLMNNAVPTVEGAVAVKNQLRFLNALYDVFSDGRLYSYQFQKYLQECIIFKEWIVKKREIFTAQEAADGNNELNRLRLFNKVGVVEDRPKYRRILLNDEESDGLKLVKQYLINGHPYTAERQLEMENIMTGIRNRHHLYDLKESNEDVVVDMPMAFTAGQWFKCRQGHIYHGGVKGDAMCAQCSASVKTEGIAAQQNEVATKEKAEGGVTHESKRLTIPKQTKSSASVKTEGTAAQQNEVATKEKAEGDVTQRLRRLTPPKQRKSSASVNTEGTAAHQNEVAAKEKAEGGVTHESKRLTLPKQTKSSASVKTEGTAAQQNEVAANEKNRGWCYTEVIEVKEVHASKTNE